MVLLLALSVLLLSALLLALLLTLLLANCFGCIVVGAIRAAIVGAVVGAPAVVSSLSSLSTRIETVGGALNQCGRRGAFEQLVLLVRVDGAK